MRTDSRLALALVAGIWLQLVPWVQLTRDARALVLAGVVAAAVVGAGWGSRRARLAPGVVAGVQAAVAAASVLIGLVVLHGPITLARTPLPELAASGVDVIRGSAAPLTPHPGVTLLIGLGLALVALLADTAAATLRRPGPAVGALVLLYGVVAVALATPMLFSEFVLLAVGVAGVLFAAGTPASGRGTITRLAAWATVVAVTASAIAVTWAVAQLVPTLQPLKVNEPLQMSDPSVDLKRNLVQGGDEVVIRYTTDRPTGAYLKLASLPLFTTAGFGLADVRVATGRLPATPGLTGGGVTRNTVIEVGAFDSEWLPVPYAPAEFRAPGNWGFALDTLDVMAMAGPTRKTATHGISYEVRSVDVRPAADALARAGSAGGPNRELHLAMPAEVPQRVRQLAREITAGGATAGAKAQAIERYLSSDRFTYSTAPTVGQGDGISTIDDFLFRSRRGYCEQFAGAMAILAREVGIPTRMAVGFTPGAKVGDAWEVTARDLHTWPELWLDGYGWVAFEPTPSRGVPNAQVDPTTDPSGAETPVDGGEETIEPTSESSESAEATPTVEASPTDGGGIGGVGGWLGWVVVVALAGLLATGLFVGPRALRARRRRLRLAGSGDPRADTVAAWDEVRDTAGDSGIAWPAGSPRFAAERLAGRLGDDEAAVAALRSLAVAAERAMYDRSEAYDGPGAWSEEVMAVVAALEALRQRSARYPWRR